MGGATRVVMERNPYFWQVDTDGKQLPYIDRLTFGISQDVESLMLDAISGASTSRSATSTSLPEQADAGRRTRRRAATGWSSSIARSAQQVPDLPQHHA